jgi:hypothetical protein
MDAIKTAMSAEKQQMQERSNSRSPSYRIVGTSQQQEGRQQQREDRYSMDACRALEAKQVKTYKVQSCFSKDDLR